MLESCTIVMVTIVVMMAAVGVLFVCGCLVWMRACLRRMRLMEGICARCGYNLTGLTEPRCPECGEAFDRSHIRDSLG